MPKVGDRVIIEGNKVGQQRREGRLVGATGPLIRVRWADGSESLIKPGAGSVTFLPGNGSKGVTPAARSGPKAVAPKGAGKGKGKGAGKPAKKR